MTSDVNIFVENLHKQSRLEHPPTHASASVLRFQGCNANLKHFAEAASIVGRVIYGRVHARGSRAPVARIQP
jgi:hypothetical protein